MEIYTHLAIRSQRPEKLDSVIIECLRILVDVRDKSQDLPLHLVSYSIGCRLLQNNVMRHDTRHHFRITHCILARNQFRAGVQNVDDCKRIILLCAFRKRTEIHCDIFVDTDEGKRL